MGGAAALGAVVVFDLSGRLGRAPAEAAAPSGALYRGAPGGTIQRSEDGGLTWTTHTRFGSETPVLAVTSSRGRVLAHLGCGARSFTVALDDGGNQWRTV
jgi:hypothetical protein